MSSMIEARYASYLEGDTDAGGNLNRFVVRFRAQAFKSHELGTGAKNAPYRCPSCATITSQAARVIFTRVERPRDPLIGSSAELRSVSYAIRQN
jgi:hypothetical protein